MRKKLISKTILIVTISSFSYLFFIFLKYFNSSENIEERCTIKFQKDFKKGLGKSDEEWGLILDEADINYLKCVGIP